MQFKVGDKIKNSDNEQGTVIQINKMGLTHSIKIKWDSGLEKLYVGKGKCCSFSIV